MFLAILTRRGEMESSSLPPLLVTLGCLLNAHPQSVKAQMDLNLELSLLPLLTEKE